MKNIVKRAIILTVLTGISFSCTEDYLDLENQNKITEESYYDNEESAFQAIVSCYDVMKANGLYGLQMQWVYYSIDGFSFFEDDVWNDLSFSTEDGHISSVFDHLYRGMYRCNVALNKIPEIEMDSAKKKRFIAEAKFFRGFYSFHLGFMFGTPTMINKPIEPDEQKGYTNSEPGELFDTAIANFKAAAEGLPLTATGSEAGRVTQGAANAMAGKVYLWKGEWDSAAIYLEKVINSNVYSLVTPNKDDSLDYFSAYLSNFTAESFNGYGGENNEESVLEVQNTFDEQYWNKHLPGYGCDGSLLTRYFGFVTGSYQNFAPLNEVADLFETPGPAGMAADPRMYATLMMPGDTTEFRQEYVNSQHNGEYPVWDGFPKNTFSGDYGCRKYYFPVWYDDGLTNDPNNWRIIRYADVLLMCAEAKYRIGESAQALSYLNEIRDRVGMTELTTISKEDIIHERMVEFMFELNPVIHLIRWSTQEGSWVPDMREYIEDFVIGKHELFPIPQYEIDFQGGTLNQNPGW